MKEKMPASQGDKGLLEKYKGLNKLTRNGALAVAAGSVFVGGPAAFLVAPALLWAAGDQAQIMLIDKFQKRNERKSNLPKSGNIYLRPKAV